MGRQTIWQLFHWENILRIQYEGAVRECYMSTCLLKIFIILRVRYFLTPHFLVELAPRYQFVHEDNFAMWSKWISVKHISLQRQ